MLWYCIHSFYIFGAYCSCTLSSVGLYIMCWILCTLSFICSPLSGGTQTKLCTVPLNWWQDAVNSNVGGSGVRDLLYYLGRRVGDLLGAGLDLWTVIGQNIRDRVIWTMYMYLVVNITARLLTNYVFYADGIIYAVMQSLWDRWYQQRVRRVIFLTHNLKIANIDGRNM